METLVRRIGNSQGITIPKPLCDELGITVGSRVKLAADGSCLTIKPIRDDTALRIGAAKGEKLVSDDFFSRELDLEIAEVFEGAL